MRALSNSFLNAGPEENTQVWLWMDSNARWLTVLLLSATASDSTWTNPSLTSVERKARMAESLAGLVHDVERLRTASILMGIWTSDALHVLGGSELSDSSGSGKYCSRNHRGSCSTGALRFWKRWERGWWQGAFLSPRAEPACCMALASTACLSGGHDHTILNHRDFPLHHSALCTQPARVNVPIARLLKPEWISHATSCERRAHAPPHDVLDYAHITVVYYIKPALDLSGLEWELMHAYCFLVIGTSMRLKQESWKLRRLRPRIKHAHWQMKAGNRRHLQS